MAVLWLGRRSVSQSPGAARWLSFGLSCCLFPSLFLIPGFPAVGDLRQDFLESFYVLCAPQAQPNTTSHRFLWCWNLAGENVTTEGRFPYTQFLRNLPCREFTHYGSIVPDSSEVKSYRQNFSVGMLQGVNPPDIPEPASTQDDLDNITDEQVEQTLREARKIAAHRLHYPARPEHKLILRR